MMMTGLWVINNDDDDRIIDAGWWWQDRGCRMMTGLWRQDDVDKIVSAGWWQTCGCKMMMMVVVITGLWVRDNDDIIVEARWWCWWQDDDVADRVVDAGWGCCWQGRGWRMRMVNDEDDIGWWCWWLECGCKTMMTELWIHDYYYYWSLVYGAILRSRADSLRLHVILHEWLAFFIARFWISTGVVYLQRWHGWCHMKLLPSRRVLCTPYNHAPCHFMQSHIRKVYACLAVTCHLHFWQSDRGLLRAAAVTRGWNRKFTLKKKMFPPLQQGFEPATFWSRVRRSNHWAIPADADDDRTVGTGWRWWWQGGWTLCAAGHNVDVRTLNVRWWLWRQDFKRKVIAWRQDFKPKVVAMTSGRWVQSAAEEAGLWVERDQNNEGRSTQ